MFELFDRDGDLRITEGNLPHWYQPGVTYFVTFRTEDSLPKEVADLWYRRRDDWLRGHGISSKTPEWKALFLQLPNDAQAEFHRTFSREYLAHLDRGYGECVLRRPELALIVANSLRHFDRQRYHLGDCVVMPNHVHLLTCLLGDTDIEKQCYSWKKFSAREINRSLGRTGRFWQEESFDHLIRSADEFEWLRRYIIQNGSQAGLRDGEYLLLRSPGIRQ